MCSYKHSALCQLTKDNIDDHIFELYSTNVPPNNLGFINNKSNKLLITLPRSQIDLEITQSISQLSSKSASNSTTGFVCWQVSVLFADWILSSPNCPFKLNEQDIVFELGSGIGGICASTISKKVDHFIGSDQKHILKLLKENIENNSSDFISSTIDSNSNSTNSSKHINVVEFDWEQPEYGIHNLHKVVTRPPDLIIACDTIYNEYLIKPFIKSLKTLLGLKSVALIAVQLRDAITLESFVTALINDDEISSYTVSEQYLSDELRRGFQIYCIERIQDKHSKV